MIITISGQVGAGKSSLARALAKKLCYKHHSMGQIRKLMAKEKGLTITEFNKLAEEDPYSDRHVDEFAKRLGEREDNLVIDGRLVYHFIPHAIKILILADEHSRAERIFKDLKNRVSENYKTVEDTLHHIRERDKSDRKRYAELYSIKEEFEHPEKFDLVLETSDLSLEETIKKVLEYLEKKK